MMAAARGEARLLPLVCAVGLLALRPALAQDEPAKREPTPVGRITATPQKAGGVLVTVVAAGPVRYTSFRLSATLEAPERLVVDIEDAFFPQGTLTQPVDSGGVSRVRASQYSTVPPVVRVVLDLAEPSPVRVLTQSPSAEISVAVGEIDEQPTGTGETSPPGTGPQTPTGPILEQRPDQKLHLLKVEAVASSPETFDLCMTLDGQADPVLILTADPNCLGIDVPDAAPEATKGVPSGWVDVPFTPTPGVRWVRLAELPSGDTLSSRITVGLDRMMPYDLARDPSTPNAWRLSLRVTPPYRGVVIVDPGHGGTEAGAMDPSRTIHEEDLNLQVALKLRAELLKRGICAILTRTANTSVDLFHRPEIANEADADLFVSIHHNSGASDTSGTETWYTSAASRPFAESVEAALVAALHLHDRGAKAGRLVVTRETQMPAALAEIAFLDVPDELKLVIKDDFQQRAASAIADVVESTLKSLGRG